MCAQGKWRGNRWCGPPRSHLRPKFEKWCDALCRAVDVSGAFYLTLVPIRPRRRGERRSLRTCLFFPAVVSLRPPLAFDPDTPRRLSTPLLTPFNSASDAFRLRPDVRSRRTTLESRLDGAAREIPGGRRRARRAVRARRVLPRRRARARAHAEPPPSLRSCLLYTSPSPRDLSTSRMPSSA